MPYSKKHKQQTRGRIVDAARRLFKKSGYDGVGIDKIMAAANLTRGGFYAHFSSKDDLFAEAIEDLQPPPAMKNRFFAARRMTDDDITAFIQSYLSQAHRVDAEDGCPLSTLSVDVGRSGPATRATYTRGLQDAIGRFQRLLEGRQCNSRQTAYGLLATCVGGMVLARAVDDRAVADDILDACRETALRLLREADAPAE